jgi:hypothetical protein
MYLMSFVLALISLWSADGKMFFGFLAKSWAM